MSHQLAAGYVRSSYESEPLSTLEKSGHSMPWQNLG